MNILRWPVDFRFPRSSVIVHDRVCRLDLIDALINLYLSIAVTPHQMLTSEHRWRRAYETSLKQLLYFAFVLHGRCL